MTTSLLSAQWYRVAQVRPHLGAQVQMQRQHWREQRWYLLSDAATGLQHRINEAAYQFIGRCDGQRTAHEVWQALLDAQPDTAPTQDEVLSLLGQLSEQGLLLSEHASPAQMLIQRRNERRRRQRRSLLNPLSFRLPLGDPSAWLHRLDPLAQALFRPLAFWLWLLAMGLALAVVAIEWPALHNHARLHLFNSTSLVLAFVIYPLMKALHELGHALAVRRWGGEVHEFGMGLLFFVPAPYVDASAASAFTQRYQKAMVGAAGLMVELGLAALGLCVWLLTQPSWLNQVGFAAFFIGSTSSLLFNGNPLLRFDAYHVMCDALDLPNLGARSNSWWSQRLGRWLLGSRSEVQVHAPSERVWLWTYAPLSLAYRITLSVALVLWLGGQWVLLGLLACAYCTLTVLLQPLFGWSRRGLSAAQPGREQARVRLRLALVGLCSASALFVVPVPLSTLAPAVVWLPEQAQVRAGVDGFVAEWLVSDGAMVQPGELLLRLEHPELIVTRDLLANRLESLLVEQFQQLMRDPNAAQNITLDMGRVQAELQRANERVARLQVRAEAAGRLSVPQPSDLLGSFVRQGATLGYVLAPDNMVVRAAVAESDAYLVRHRLHKAEVRLGDGSQQDHPATLRGEVPSATRQLPSAALTAPGGGPYAIDPSEKDGLHSLAPVFLIDLTLTGQTLARVGGRAWVRFDHGSEALALQLYRHASQLFLKHFSPAG